MKALAFSFLLLTTLAGLTSAHNVEIPDTAFLYALIDVGVDTDGDSLISHAEAEAITYLNIGDFFKWYGIRNLDGIEVFVNLKHLD